MPPRPDPLAASLYGMAFAYHHRQPHFHLGLPALLLGLACGILVGFGVTFAGWIGAGPEACCPVGAGDLAFGALLGVAVVLWGRVMRVRYERNGDEGLRVRSRRRR